MKKLVGMLLVLAMLMGCVSASYAAELGVQVIGGPETEGAAPAKLDDMMLNVPAEIPGFGTITMTEFHYQDNFYYTDSGWDSGNFSSIVFHSGAEADYACLEVDIVNTTHTPIDYTQGAKITVIYNGDYELGGWVYQYNLDAGDNVRSNATNPVDPYYAGHYKFGCTLPNAIVLDDKTPLQMVIMLGEHELTYNIRK